MDGAMVRGLQARHDDASTKRAAHRRNVALRPDSAQQIEPVGPPSPSVTMQCSCTGPIGWAWRLAADPIWTARIVQVGRGWTPTAITTCCRPASGGRNHNRSASPGDRSGTRPPEQPMYSHDPLCCVEPQTDDRMVIAALIEQISAHHRNLAEELNQTCWYIRGPSWIRSAIKGRPSSDGSCARIHSSSGSNDK